MIANMSLMRYYYFIKRLVYIYPGDISGTVVGENQDCLLLPGNVVGESPDHVCWVHIFAR